MRVDGRRVSGKKKLRIQKYPDTCGRSLSSSRGYRRIHADVIVYIFAHLHTALRIEENMLDMN